MAVQETYDTPRAKDEPDVVLHAVLLTAWLSLALSVHETTTLGDPSVGATKMLPGHVICGATVSTTRTLNEQEAVSPMASLAVQVTMLGAVEGVMANMEADAGRQDMVGANPELSKALGAW